MMPPITDAVLLIRLVILYTELKAPLIYVSPNFLICFNVLKNFNNVVLILARSLVPHGSGNETSSLNNATASPYAFVFLNVVQSGASGRLHDLPIVSLAKQLAESSSDASSFNFSSSSANLLSSLLYSAFSSSLH